MCKDYIIAETIAGCLSIGHGLKTNEPEQI